MLDDLQSQIDKYKNIVDEIGDANSVTQKIDYWKKKNAESLERLDDIEAKLMRYAPKDILDKIYE